MMRLEDYDVNTLAQLPIPQPKAGKKKLTFPAIKSKQGDVPIFSFSTDAKQMFPMTTVDRAGDGGYQRYLDERRAQRIARYVDRNGSVPGNIIMHASVECDFIFDNKHGTVSFIPGKGIFQVLDGQHRQFGFALAQTTEEVVYTVYVGLDDEQLVQLFMDINSTQKGVPSALITYLKGPAGRESPVEQELRNLFNMFFEAKASSLGGKLLSFDRKVGMISRRSFNLGLKPVFRLTSVRAMDMTMRFQLLDSFFRSIRNVVGDAEFFKSINFTAFCAVFEKVTTMSKTQFNNVRPESLAAIVKPLEEFAPESTLGPGQTRVNKMLVVEHITALLGDTMPISAEDI